MIAELRQVESVDTVNEKDVDDKTTPNKADASSGRLFLRKFLLFRNIFGNSNTQPVIPIIITGAGTGTTGATNPTTTITSTGSVPTATGTITTSPTTPTGATGRGPEDPEEDEEEAIENAVALDEQTLQAALAAGAQEYVVTDEEIKGTSDGKASKQPSRVNLKRKGDKKGQTISVRIPPKYRRYFKNGQRVMLNTGNRPAKQRVVRRRVNKNRKRVNRNKNTNMRKRVIGV